MKKSAIVAVVLYALLALASLSLAIVGIMKGRKGDMIAKRKYLKWAIIVASVLALLLIVVCVCDYMKVSSVM